MVFASFVNSLFLTGALMTQRLVASPTGAPIALRAGQKHALPVDHAFKIRGVLATAVLVAASLLGSQARAEGDLAAGKTVFANQCASCHTVETGKNGFGPSLAAVFGRKAGTLPGYKYSPAMVNSGLTWDEKTLDLFLTSSSKEVPGTAMPVSLPDATARANVIAYLETLGRASAVEASAPAAHEALANQGPTQNELLHAAHDKQ